MLELEEAVSRVLASVPTATGETIELAQADGRILVKSVDAAKDLPPFDNSAMDGYAVRTMDVAQATKEKPVLLRIVGKVAAGGVFSKEVQTGTCVRLFTGSRLPAGADAVVMQEDTEAAEPESVRILESARPWENIRFRGEDVKHGAVVLEVGERLEPARLSLLAATGCSRVDVGRQPVVGLLATGSELREPGAELGEAQIYESNRIGLGALVSRTGGISRSYPLVPDTLEATREALGKAFGECDIVVSSGGVSVGEMDFVKRALAETGGELQFWKVAIRPGRPFVFGKSKGKLFFGLPGNPVSALVTFLLLVRPVLLRWQGAKQTGLATQPGVLAEALANPGDRRHFLRVNVSADGKVRSAGVQASHILSSLAVSNGMLDLPPFANLIAGAPVRVLRWG